MEDKHLGLDLGMLCLFCDNHSYKLPDVEGLTPAQRHQIEEICKLCIDNSKRHVVNS